MKVDVISGVQPLALQNVQVFPNPASEQVFIQIPGIESSIEVAFIGMDGKVWQGETTSKDGSVFAVQLDHMPSGIYAARIKMNDSIIVRKIQIR